MCILTGILTGGSTVSFKFSGSFCVAKTETIMPACWPWGRLQQLIPLLSALIQTLLLVSDLNSFFVRSSLNLCCLCTDVCQSYYVSNSCQLCSASLIQNLIIPTARLMPQWKILTNCVGIYILDSLTAKYFKSL